MHYKDGLCPFKHIFGAENTGIHSIRLLNIAIIDVIGTIIGSIIISYIFKVNVYKTLIIAFVSSIIIHKLFCVQTTLTKFVFGTV